MKEKMMDGKDGVGFVGEVGIMKRRVGLTVCRIDIAQRLNTGIGITLASAS